MDAADKFDPSGVRKFFPDDLSYFAFIWAAGDLTVEHRGSGWIVKEWGKRFVFDDQGQLKKLQAITFQQDGRPAAYTTMGEA
jgi:hypothetical protein